MAGTRAQAAAQETTGLTHASLKALLGNACPPCYRFGVTFLKQAVFSIAFAVTAVAVAEYVVWLLEQNGWINP
jgi:hypothetical protein